MLELKDLGVTELALSCIHFIVKYCEHTEERSSLEHMYCYNRMDDNDFVFGRIRI